MRNRIALKAIIAAVLAVGVVVVLTASSTPMPKQKVASFHVPTTTAAPSSAELQMDWEAVELANMTPFFQALHTQAVTAQATAMALAAAQAALQAEQNAQAAAASSSETAAPAPAPTQTDSGNDGGWAAVAMCEEGGNNDPNYGYYGIKEWNGFDGYPTAGSAPQSVQLQWEAQNIGAPPDESGGCHSY